MELDFFPSRTLTIYLAKLFVTRVLAILVMLVIVLQMLDLLSESGDILAVPGNGEAQLWFYVSLRFPQLIARFLPYSVLLATLLTFWPLNQNSEVIAMRASGLSAHQILAPLMLAAAVVAVVSFAFNERFVTRANATMKAWQDAGWGAIPKDPESRSNVYLKDGNNILLAGTLSGHGAATRMENVTWYKRNAAMMVTDLIRAPSATYAAPGWRLDKPVSFDVEGTSSRPLAAMVVGRDVTPAQIAVMKVNAEGQSIIGLHRTITAMKDAGRRTSELEGMWWHRISGPLAALLMPLLGSVAAFGLARSGQLLVRGVIGMALGFAYFVIDNAALAIGNFGGYPPLIAAWTPFFLFLFVGETVLIRTEE